MELYGEKQVIEGMRTVRKNTIQIAEDIPEEDYVAAGRRGQLVWLARILVQ